MISSARSTVAGVVALALLLAAALTGPLATNATAQDTPEEPVWTSTYIDTVDGESLFVDVLHPANLPPEAGPRPVMLVVSPYLGDEAGQDWTRRFSDFYFGAYGGEGIFANGWSVVQVHTRGTSGSTGCLDILGPGEQTDIVTGVEWVNDQPWADGVAMYGKSYDANTGAAALANRPAGLDAVIAQAIGPDRYRATHNDRVRLAQSLLYPSVTYGLGAEANFSTGSDTTYIANSAAHSADCQAHFVDHYRDDETLPFWTVRDFPDRAAGAQIPTFITAGYLDNATNIGGGALDLFNALEGPKHLWIGWWEHKRGNDTNQPDSRTACDTYNPDPECESAIGRDDWFAATTAFLERHVRGTSLADIADDPRMTYPDYTVAAQTSDGTWRAEESLPAADTVRTEMALRSGTYTDDGQGRGSNGFAGAGGLVTIGSANAPGIWTFSDPLAESVHIAGIPVATLFLDPDLPRTNVVVNIYDVDPTGNAVMVNRGAGMIDAAGEEVIRMWPTDWVFAPGHRIGVRVMDANTENYVHVPTFGDVVMRSGRVDLPVLPAGRATTPTDGTTNGALEAHKRTAGFNVSAELAEATAPLLR